MTRFREATPKDDSQLLKLTNSASMPGIIRLMTNRKPSFFNLVEQRGLSKVIVAEEDNQIKGSICVTHETAFINKVAGNLFYISDFRVEQSNRKKGLGLQLTNRVVDYMEEQGADLVFLNVSKGNKRPFVFFSNRTKYPDFENIGIFKIYQFLGSSRTISNGFEVIKTTVTQPIVDFFNEFYKNYELAPVLDSKLLDRTSIYIVKEKGDLVAAMCLGDYDNCKQHIVLELPWYLKLTISGMNIIRTIKGAKKLPGINQPIKMLYVKYMAVKKHDKRLIKSLIRKAQNEVHFMSYSFVSLGLHEKDPLIQRLPSFFRMTFNSVGMLVTMKNNQKLMQLVKKGIPYKDFSTV